MALVVEAAAPAIKTLLQGKEQKNHFILFYSYYSLRYF